MDKNNEMDAEIENAGVSSGPECIEFLRRRGYTWVEIDGYMRTVDTEWNLAAFLDGE